MKYVITLDTDTQLPRDAGATVRRRDGAPAEPRAFRQAVAGAATTGLVTEGYGILQPRVGISLPGANRSWYARLHGGDPGIDPYTRAVSDVYQDVFHEGSFIGKGIYDVDAFEQALNDRFPENRILSHDLIEGCYARSGLLSDVQLYEEYPSTYSADMGRRHRVDSRRLAAGRLAAAARARSRPSAGSGIRCPRFRSWKLFDNLRRSLVPRGAHASCCCSDGRVLPHAVVVDAGGARDSAAAVGLRVHRAVVARSRTTCCRDSTSPPPRASRAATPRKRR